MSFDSGQRRAFAPDLATTYALVALALVALRVLLMPIAPHDFWWHLAQGARIGAQSAVPQLDYYSYTQDGQPFFNQMWLAQWLLFLFYQLGGLPFIIFMQALIVTGSYALLLWLAARRSADTKIAALILLLGVMPVSFDNWLVRPQTFALPCFALFVTILTSYRLRWWPRALWLLPVIEIAWVNLHGSFLLGVFLVLLTLLGETIRHWRHEREVLTRGELAQLAGCLALCVAAIFVNPRGAGVLDYVQLVLNMPQTRLSSEWLPPDISTFNGVYFWLFFIAFLWAMWSRRWRLNLTDALIALPFGLQAACEGRSAIWFAMLSLPIFAVALGSRRAAMKSPDERPVFNLVLLLFVWLLPLCVLPWWKPALGLPPQIGSLIDEETPVAAVNFLRTIPKEKRPQRLWHDEATGSYLIWAAPGQKVFNDTRFEFYPMEQWQDAIDLRYARRAPETIAKYRFDGFLLHHERHAKLIDYLEKSGRWRLVYRDRFWRLLLKQ